MLCLIASGPAAKPSEHTRPKEHVSIWIEQTPAVPSPTRRRLVARHAMHPAWDSVCDWDRQVRCVNVI